MGVCECHVTLGELLSSAQDLWSPGPRCSAVFNVAPTVMVQAWQPAVICFGSLVGGLKGSSRHGGCGSVSTNMTANGGLFKWDCWFEAGNPGAWLCAVPVRVVCRVGTIGVFVGCREGGVVGAGMAANRDLRECFGGCDGRISRCGLGVHSSKSV